MGAWSKSKLGWVNVVRITDPGTYLVSQACTSNTVYRLDHKMPDGEYLLIENRYPCGFDSELWHESKSPGRHRHGIAIWHIDESNLNSAVGYQSEGYPGGPGYPKLHYMVALEQADGHFDLEKGYNRGDSTDLFRRSTYSEQAGTAYRIAPNGVTLNNGNTEPYPNTNSYANGEIRNTGIELEFGEAASTMTMKVIIDGRSGATPKPSPSPTPPPTSSPTLAPTPLPTPPPTLAPTPPPTPLPTSPPTFEPMNITKFVLVDSISNEDFVGGLSCTPARIGSASKFDIRAETSGPVQSVKLTLTGRMENVRVENVAPYAAFGDRSGHYIGSTLPPDSYTVLAQPFSLPGANGLAGPVQSLDFVIPGPPTAPPTPAPVVQPTDAPVAPTPVPSLRPTKAPTALPTAAPTSSIGISKFVLVDTATDLDVPGGFDCMPTVCVGSATSFNIRAETFGDVKSVRLRLTGGLFADRVENASPFSAFGDVSGIYFGKELPPGTYTIKAEAYPLRRARGTPSPAKTLQFMIA